MSRPTAIVEDAFQFAMRELQQGKTNSNEEMNIHLRAALSNMAHGLQNLSDGLRATYILQITVTRRSLPYIAPMLIVAHDPHRPRRRPRPAASRDVSVAPGGSALSSREATMLSIVAGSANLPPLRRRGHEAYCQMPNHVHLILAPEDAEGRALTPGKGAGSTPASSTRGRARRATCFRGGSVRWHVDEDHLMAAARYVALNPAPARQVGRARDWPHSRVMRASHPAATTGSWGAVIR